MLGQSQNISLSQSFSPRQIQLMQLLQLPVMELEQRIKEELEKNPTLEEAHSAEVETPDKQEDFETQGADERNSEYDDDYFQQYMEDDPGSYQQKAGADADEYAAPGSYTADETSFFEYLMDQLMGLEFESHQEVLIGKQIIGNLNDDGYLGRTLSAMADDLLINYHLDVKKSEIERVLKIVQTLEPAGLAARDLRECLLLQLASKIEDGEDGDIDIMVYADLILAQTIVRDHFELFTKKHYEKLREKLEVDEDELRDGLGEILRLNPKPASGLLGAAGGRAAQAIVPDFVLNTVDEKFRLQLTARNAPDLRINDHYQQMLADYRRKQKEAGKLSKAQKQAAGFIRQNIDSATWFIEAIQQRQQTLFSVMHAILRYQEGYFKTGDTATLRPMILKDIAEVTGLDISTISRVANSKYIQTDFGTFSLRTFFSEGMTNQEGEEVSTTQIKKVLSEIIADENKRKPLADGKLQKALAEAGYDIARRTVAKYREQLGLPVARLRKEL
ncbi:MAG: RNA polymerase sigma-54 factor [Neolewinella sp.]|jgi:RNA polymerase sigma-54 factor|nr:RNA polymerase factor sigma-54 [Lewinella sp.]